MKRELEHTKKITWNSLYTEGENLANGAVAKIHNIPKLGPRDTSINLRYNVIGFVALSPLSNKVNTRQEF